MVRTERYNEKMDSEKGASGGEEKIKMAAEDNGRRIGVSEG